MDFLYNTYTEKLNKRMLEMKSFFKDVVLSLFTRFMFFVVVLVAAVVFMSHKSDVEEYKKQKAMHVECVAKGLQHCPSMPKLSDYGLTEKDVQND